MTRMTRILGKPPAVKSMARGEVANLASVRGIGFARGYKPHQRRVVATRKILKLNFTLI